MELEYNIPSNEEDISGISKWTSTTEELTQMGLHIRRMDRLGLYDSIDFLLCNIEETSKTDMFTVVLRASLDAKKKDKLPNWDYAFTRIRNILIKRYGNADTVDRMLLYGINE